MSQFEYHILRANDRFLTRNGGGDASETLNDFGKDGWEICAALDGTDHGEYILILRRESN